MRKCYWAFLCLDFYDRSSCRMHVLNCVNIPHSILKTVKDIVAPSLTDLLNGSIKAKIFPDDFKIAKVTPIFKNGETDNLGNHRSISILGSIARVFEKLLYKQLYDFLIENKILNTQQCGFRPVYSKALALIDCSSNWLLDIKKLSTQLITTSYF